MVKLFVIIGLLISLDSFAQLINSDYLRKQKFYDSTLNGMILRDANSIERIIGTSENIVDSDDEETDVINEDGSQLLTLIFLPGDAVNQFSQFKVEFNAGSKKSKLKIADKEFITGKSIKLGLTERELLKVLGSPKEKKKEGDYLIYSYHQNNGLYFGHYYFHKGRLTKFWFGEEYP